MRSARQITLAAIGTVVALAGFEHGLGELLQGPVRPATPFIQSWPDAAFYESLQGEPAMTLIPNLAISGVITMLLSAVLFVWVVWNAGRRRSGLVIASLSVALLMVGGGFGPPILGLIVSAAAFKVNSPLKWWSSRCGGRLAGGFSAAWAAVLVVCVAMWLMALFGIAGLDYLLGFESVAFTVTVLAIAFLLLPAAFATSFARDACSPSRRTDSSNAR